MVIQWMAEETGVPRESHGPSASKLPNFCALLSVSDRIVMLRGALVRNHALSTTLPSMTPKITKYFKNAFNQFKKLCSYYHY